MKKCIYAISMAVLVLCAGCSAEKKTVPTKEEYKNLIREICETSVDGVQININEEVRKFEKASDEEKRELYDKALKMASKSVMEDLYERYLKIIKEDK